MLSGHHPPTQVCAPSSGSLSHQPKAGTAAQPPGLPCCSCLRSVKSSHKGRRIFKVKEIAEGSIEILPVNLREALTDALPCYESHHRAKHCSLWHASEGWEKQKPDGDSHSERNDSFTLNQNRKAWVDWEIASQQQILNSPPAFTTRLPCYENGAGEGSTAKLYFCAWCQVHQRPCWSAEDWWGLDTTNIFFSLSLISSVF